MLPTHTRPSKDSIASALGRRIRQRRFQLFLFVFFAFLFVVYLVVSNNTNPNTVTSSIVNPIHTLDSDTKLSLFNPTSHMTVLSWNPRIFTYRSFLSSEECDFLINLGKDKLERSKVVGSKKDEIIPDRSSSGYWIPYDQSKFVDERIAAITHIPIEHGEQLHLLHYEKTQQYKPHFDWFPRNLNEAQEEQIRVHGQRIATVIIFLCDVEEGGETWFPRPNIKITPKKGDAVLFYDLNVDGTEDNEALHGGMPVSKGEKWIVTKWLRQRKWRT
jgi:prolyl 4-hydroxylase